MQLTSHVEATEVIPAAKPVRSKDDVAETPLEALASICSVIAMLLFVQGFIFQNFEIPSASMEKTLLIGDHVVVDRATLAPPTKWAPFVHYRPVQRGDVIVFYKPNPESPDLILVKRCIGIPGDRIHLRHGVVYLNGVAQNEPYAQQPTDDDDPEHSYVPYRDDFPSITPPLDAQLTEVWRQELPQAVGKPSARSIYSREANSLLSLIRGQQLPHQMSRPLRKLENWALFYEQQVPWEAAGSLATREAR